MHVYNLLNNWLQQHVCILGIYVSKQTAAFFSNKKPGEFTLFLF